MKPIATFALVSLTACAAAPAAPAPKHTFAIGTSDFLLNDQRFGPFVPNPLDFERFGNCGEFAIIKNPADETRLILIPSNSTELEIPDSHAFYH